MPGILRRLSLALHSFNPDKRGEVLSYEQVLKLIGENSSSRISGYYNFAKRV